MRRVQLSVLFAAGLLGLAGEATPAVPPALVCKIPRDETGTLPPTARHGIVSHLPQYPVLSLATPVQRARARLILDRLVAAAKRGNWRDVRAARRAGYDTTSRDR